MNFSSMSALTNTIHLRKLPDPVQLSVGYRNICSATAQPVSQLQVNSIYNNAQM